LCYSYYPLLPAQKLTWINLLNRATQGLCSCQFHVKHGHVFVSSFFFYIASMLDSDTPATVPILTYPPKTEAIALAAQALHDGAIIGLATETVFGVVADAAQSGAVQALYAAKGRNEAVPLQILVPDRAIAEELGHFSEAAYRLAARYWPGPLTLVVPLRRSARELLAPEIFGTQEELKIGIRVPAHPVPQALLRAYGAPLAASSANLSGEPAAKTAHEADAALGTALACILDGPCDPTSLASSVVDASTTPVRVLREGALSINEIMVVVG
jgi:L-threonylcarbamoyladenylate synthase